MRSWGTPVPIPNTMVKTWTADGTLLETARESRWMPPLKKKIWATTEKLTNVSSCDSCLKDSL